MKISNTYCKNKFRLYLFRVTCMLLAFAFMPDVSWADSMEIQPDQIENPVSESENGEEGKKDTPEEEVEDSSDSVLYASTESIVLLQSACPLDWHSKTEPLAENISEIHLPPPRQ